MSKKTAYKRRDGRWECRISMGKDENGRRVFRSFYGKSRDEAEYKAMIALDHSEDEYAVTEMTVRELVTEWLHVTASRIKESTAANYVMKAEKHLIPAFGEIKCCLLKAKDIYAFIERKIKEGLSVRYLSDIIVLFKSVFRYASREYRIRNVLDGIVLPKKNKPEIAVMNKKQQLRLEKYLDERPSVTSVGIAISMYMGLRIGEVYVVSGRKKPVEPRTMQYRFAKILHNADLPSFHYHSLRHLFATRCVELGFDVKTLSEILGHSSVEVTLNRYIHSDMERKRTCMSLLSKCA